MPIKKRIICESYTMKCELCDYVNTNKLQRLNKKMMILHYKKNHPDEKLNITDVGCNPLDKNVVDITKGGSLRNQNKFNEIYDESQKIANEYFS